MPERAVVRRSCLSVPASDQAKIGKAMGLGADPAVVAGARRVLARAVSGGVR